MKKYLILILFVASAIIGKAQDLDSLTYQNKTNLRPIIDRTKQSTAEDWNEVKVVVNSIVRYINNDTLLILDTDTISHYIQLKDSTVKYITPYQLSISAGGHSPVTLNSEALNSGWSLNSQELTLDSADYMFKSHFAENDSVVKSAKKLDGHPYSNTAYGTSWSGSDSIPPQSAIYNKIQSLAGSVVSITLPYSTSVAGRIAAGVSGVNWPAGWTLTADGLNLIVTHNLGRWVAGVTVFAKTTGTQRQQQFNTAAYNGITCLSNNILEIYSLSVVPKEIVIYITLE